MQSIIAQTAIAGARWSAAPGQSVEIDGREADRLVQSGQAYFDRAARERKKRIAGVVLPVVECVAEAPETASAREKLEKVSQEARKIDQEEKRLIESLSTDLRSDAENFLTTSDFGAGGDIAASMIEIARKRRVLRHASTLAEGELRDAQTVASRRIANDLRDGYMKVVCEALAAIDAAEVSLAALELHNSIYESAELRTAFLPRVLPGDFRSIFNRIRARAAECGYTK